jgi:hypothetical protein
MALLEKTQKIVEFRDVVARKPQLHWAYEIQKHINDRIIAAWAASVIWWSYRNPRSDSLLFEITRDYVPAKARGRDFELNEALNKIGLPSI